MNKKDPKSFLGTTLITLLIVAMLIVSGPAQAVSVIISGLQPSYTERTPVQLQISIEITAPDQFVPVTNISLDVTGPPDISTIFSVVGTPISGDTRISITPVKYPKSKDYGYGYGYGFEDGTRYDFGNGDGYGDGKKKKLQFIYDVTINITGLPAGTYKAVANLNTGKAIKPAFSSAPVDFTITEIINAIIEIDPGKLNIESEGKWVTAHIELPEGYNVADIDVSSIELNGVIAEETSAKISDHKLKVKFNRASVQSILSPGVNIVTITGTLTSGIKFEGTDTITAKEKGKK